VISGAARKRETNPNPNPNAYSVPGSRGPSPCTSPGSRGRLTGHTETDDGFAFGFGFGEPRTPSLVQNVYRTVGYTANPLAPAFTART